VIFNGIFDNKKKYDGKKSEVGFAPLFFIGENQNKQKF
jgi:hypothetical protein